MWCKFDTQLFKRHWQAKPPQTRQRLCFLAILAWEEQGIPKDFEYVAWATGLTVEQVENLWPEFEAVSEQRNGKWMMREMWEGLDTFREKSERAKTAIEKRWNTTTNTTPNTKCITSGNTSSNTDKIRLDKIRLDKIIETTVNKGASNAHVRANPAGSLPARLEVDERLPGELDDLETAVAEASGEKSRHFRVVENIRNVAVEIRGEFTPDEVREFRRRRGGAKIFQLAAGLRLWRQQEEAARNRQSLPATALADDRYDANGNWKMPKINF